MKVKFTHYVTVLLFTTYMQASLFASSDQPHESTTHQSSPKLELTKKLTKNDNTSCESEAEKSASTHHLQINWPDKSASHLSGAQFTIKLPRQPNDMSNPLQPGSTGHHFYGTLISKLKRTQEVLDHMNSDQWNNLSAAAQEEFIDNHYAQEQQEIAHLQKKPSILKRLFTQPFVGVALFMLSNTKALTNHAPLLEHANIQAVACIQAVASMIYQLLL
ncbi:MAG TPA: hypothetical protein VGT41_01325 [Candidatus Babeliales bacterium]|nr:hypothetical protein [Candidatus Babeliales bacterium]